MAFFRENDFTRASRRRTRHQGFVSLMPYERFLKGGIIRTKSGAYVCAFRVHPPDMESESAERNAQMCAALGQAFSRLEDGWGVWFNVISRPRRKYVERGALWHPTMLTVDEAQRRRFEDASANFERECVVSLVYQPPAPAKQRIFVSLTGSGLERSLSLQQQVSEFERQISEIVGALSPWVGLTPLGDAELLAHLEECIDGVHQHRIAPPRGRLLDTLLGHEFIFGYRPTIDGRHLRVVALSEFPPESYPLMLAALGHLPLPYRFHIRLTCYDVATADRLLAGYTRSWGNKLYGFWGAVNRALGGTPRENPYAVEMMNDVLAARAENEHGDYRPVGYTAGFILHGDDATEVDGWVKLIMRETRYRGFGARDETLNCADAYLGSLPANGYFNPRRAIINTLNAAHTLCLDIPWSGPERNPSPYYPPDSPVMLIGLTKGNAAFGYCDQVDDRGNAIYLGPTGSGKTTLIAYSTLMHHRVPAAQSFNFDCGFGMYVPTLAVGGLHYNLGADDTCFQPLAEIERPEERAWAHEALSGIWLPLCGVHPTPERDQALWRALEVLATMPRRLRTFSNLKYTVQDQALRDGLTFYTQEGPAGRYLDADCDGLGAGRFVTFEMEQLMAQGERVLLPVLSYLFHRIDQRLDGRPARICADEVWIMLANARFAAKFEEWLRTCRKKNAAVVLATQSLADVANCPIRDVILESCPTKLYLPNAEARNPQTAELYRKFGLSDAQIEVIAAATPKEHYYYVSPLGRRLFSLALTPTALAFVGAGSREDIAAARRLHAEYSERWPAEWLRSRDLPDWANYLEGLRGPITTSPAGDLPRQPKSENYAEEIRP